MSQLIHGDCLEFMRGMEANSVDAIVTDPPYYGVKDEAWDNQWESEAHFIEWIGELCKQWQRILKPNGSLYVFASPKMAARVEVKIGDVFNVLNRIRWVKEAGWHNKNEKEALRAFLSPWEEIIFAEQYGDAYGDAESALHKRVYAPIGRRVAERRIAAGLERHEVDTACSPSRKPTGLCYRWEEGACLPTFDQWVDFSRLVGDPREYEELRIEYEDLRTEYEELRRPFNVTPEVPYTDVWTFRTVQAYDGKHVCEKPIALMEHIILASTKPGALVFDPFTGSGTTGVACALNGREFIGCEKDAHWHAYATKRINKATSQPRLFNMEYLTEQAAA